MAGIPPAGNGERDDPQSRLVCIIEIYGCNAACLHPCQPGRPVMTTSTDSQPGMILRGIASGLFPMAGFTPIYAIWAIFAWPLPGSFFFTAALAWSKYLLATAVRLISLSTAMPRHKTAFDARIDKGMSILGSVQGGLIVTAIVLLSVFGLAQWILPIVASIVALHFFFMPLLFDAPSITISDRSCSRSQ